VNILNRQNLAQLPNTGPSPTVRYLLQRADEDAVHPDLLGMGTGQGGVRHGVNKKKEKKERMKQLIQAFDQKMTVDNVA
jgi:hypothetical protein